MLKKTVNGIEVICSVEEENAIKAEWASNEAIKVSNDYAEKRRAEYGSIVEQLDIMFHQGFEGWRTHIQTIKDKYPKPNEK